MDKVSTLEDNLSRYPKLKILLETNVADDSRFLRDIRELMFRSGVSHRQAFMACKIIDEKNQKCLKQAMK